MTVTAIIPLDFLSSDPGDGSGAVQTDLPITPLPGASIAPGEVFRGNGATLDELAEEYVQDRDKEKFDLRRIFRSENSSSFATGSLTDPAYWPQVADLGLVNYLKAFDQNISGPVKHTGDFSYTLTTGDFADALALFGMKADQVNVTITRPDQVVTFQGNVGGNDHYERDTLWDYFFTPWTTKRQAVIMDLDIPVGSIVQIDIAGLNPSISEIIVGKSLTLGKATGQPLHGAQNFSEVKIDPIFGRVFRVIERGHQPTLDLEIWVDEADMAAVYEAIFERLLSKVFVVQFSSFARFCTRLGFIDDVQMREIPAGSQNGVERRAGARITLKFTGTLV